MSDCGKSAAVTCRRSSSTAKQSPKTIEAEVVAAIAALGFAPGLVAVRVGNDPASEIYVRSKAKKARELGLRGDELILPESTSEAELLARSIALNADDAVDGILVQLPLPKQIDAKKVIDAIDPAERRRRLSSDQRRQAPPRAPDARAVHAGRRDPADRVDRRADRRAATRS